MDVDVGSSRSAASVVGLVQGALKTLVIDIAVLLEGKSTVSCNPNFSAKRRGLHGGSGTTSLTSIYIL